ncbi:MAG: HD domain-containing protein [Coriobacteriales bacterium]|nr:HD domain-containing protein [Coriobacteriales bacterium]
MTFENTPQSTLELYHDLVQSIVSALEARDPHTAEHSLRVGDMTERVCLLMGLPEDQSTDIHMAAHVHDIGKIALPDTVLHRDRPLTPHEHELMRDHARVGAEIIGSCTSLKGIASIVLHHHEKWNGSGYPDGLAGEDMPLGARIVAVCDAIDAMMGKRLSKKALTHEACREQIEQGIGTSFDPAIARFVLDHWDEIVGPVNFRDSETSEFSWNLVVNNRTGQDTANPSPAEKTGNTTLSISRPLMCEVPKALLAPKGQAASS